MKGANEYAELFTTGQYGRLYLVSGRHARGRTFRIFVLPKGEDARPNGGDNPPLNKGAVEVYGIVGGHAGWTEQYGWIHSGPWQDDFQQLVDEAKEEQERREIAIRLANGSREKAEAERVANLLAGY